MTASLPEPNTAGTVSRIMRFPVKSMLGEELAEAEVTENGIVGDRGYGVVDLADGIVASAKNPRKWGKLLELRAAFVDEPLPGQALPPVEISSADGVLARSDHADVHAELSRFTGREVRLAASAPDDRRFEEVWPEIEGFAPDEFIAQTEASREPSGERVSEIGLGMAAPPGTFFDLSVLHLLTTATLGRLRQLEPSSDFDWRRYRPNILIDADGTGFPENDWGGRQIALGASLEATGIMPTMRCVMTTLPQDGLPADKASLRAVARHNRIEIPGLGTWACAGLYAGVAAGGRVQRGDAVTVS